MKHSIAALCVPLLLAGCAGVSIKPVSPDELAESHLHEGHHRDDGYIVYLPQVFLMATHAGKQAAAGPHQDGAHSAERTGGADASKKAAESDKQDADPPKPAEVIRVGEWEIRRLVLPDYSRPYRVHPYAFLAKTDFDMNFEEGWMMSHANGTLDSTSIISLLTAALDKIPLGTPSPARAQGTTPDSKPTPDIVLFKILNEPNGDIKLQQVKIGIVEGTMK